MFLNQCSCKPNQNDLFFFPKYRPECKKLQELIGQKKLVPCSEFGDMFKQYILF